MAVAVLAEEDEPLVAVEVTEGDVGEEVVAQVGMGSLGEGDGLGADFAELGDYYGWVGPSAGGTDGFAGDEFC